jgi:hypothetical protein
VSCRAERDHDRARAQGAARRDEHRDVARRVLEHDPDVAAESDDGPPAGPALPDARDAARTASLAGTTSAPRQDLRSPDTRDYAAGRGSFNAPAVTVVKVREPTAPPASSGGLDWGDAGIGAGVAFGLILFALGGMLVVVRHRHGGLARRATAA